MVSCEVCGKSFQPRTATHVSCSLACRQEKSRRIWRQTNPEREDTAKLNSGKVGAMHEMLVCCDLLKKGYDVFRAVSQSSSCDMVVLKEGKVIRVEVTTGGFTATGKVTHPSKDFSRFDLLAIVLHTGEIRYSQEI